MSNWPLWSGGNGGYQTCGVDPATTTLTQVTADAAANTKGAYAQLTAATVQDASGFLLHTGLPSAGGATYLLDLAIGGAGSEQVILSNFLLADQKGTQNNSGATGVFIPLKIPAGVRVAARLQCSTGGASLRVGLTLFDGGFLLPEGFQRCTTYGANTATSSGTATNADQNAMGAWGELTASTTNPIRLLYVAPIVALADTALTSTTVLFNIGVGAAASEVEVVSDIPILGSVFEDAAHPRFIGPFPVNIPAGSRLAIQHQSNNSADMHDMLWAVYGLG